MALKQTGQGLIFVLVGPTAVGKNSIIDAVKASLPNLAQLPTATTRPIRGTEAEGREHYFQTEESFTQLMVDDKLVEWQWVHSKRYGIIRETVDEAIALQNDLIADIEVLGASVVRYAYPDNAVLIFIAPPRREALAERITKRDSDNPEKAAERLSRVNFEMRYAAMCDYLVINDELEDAIDAVRGIINSERAKRNISKTLVSAAFLKDGQVLVAEHAQDKLPATLLYPGELPVDAIYRLAKDLGAGKIAIQRQEGAPDDRVAPIDFTLETDDKNQFVNLRFKCTITDAAAKTMPGQVWVAADRHPLVKNHL